MIIKYKKKHLIGMLLLDSLENIFRFIEYVAAFKSYFKISYLL